MYYNGGLRKIVKLITNNDNWQDVIRKVLATYGIGAVLFIIRRRRREKRHLYPWFRNTTALSILHLYPLLQNNKLLGSNRQFAWYIIIASALKASTRVPNWLPSYLTVEAIFDYLVSQPSLQRFLQGLEKSGLVRTRQLLFCGIVPLLYMGPYGKKWIFNQNSLVRDFSVFYLIWNLMSIYRYCKSLVRHRRKSNTPSPALIAPNDEWPLVSTSLKPLMNRLTELQELTIPNKHTLFETLMDSALVKNVTPCLRWAIWRKFCVRVLSQVKLGHTRIMKSLVLMLGFLVVDHNRQMDISPLLLKYLVCQLDETFEKTNNFKKWLTFASSNLALYTTH